MRFLRTYWLPLACALAALLKLALCAGMPLCIHAGAAYDDAWAVRAADFITQGQWLGPYDDITLIKNPGFPLWLALCMKTGAGYLLPTALLYVLASLFFALAVRPLVRRDVLFFALFALVLFCPVSFATDTYQRVYRNSITAAQALLVFGAYLGLYVRIKLWSAEGRARGASILPLVFWALVGAVALAWFWLSREDSMWVAPFVLVATVVLLVLLARRACARKAAAGERARMLASAVLVVLPLVALVAGIGAVKSINQEKYGVAVTADINSGNFARMVKALYAIDPARLLDAAVPGAAGTATDVRTAPGGMPHNQRVAVTHAALLQAYEASPTLATIMQQVEVELLEWGDTVDNDPGDGEVNGGEFFWVLRRAARDAGAYSSDASERTALAQAMAASDASGKPDAQQGEASVDVLLRLTPAQFADAFYGVVADELEAALANSVLPQRATMPSSIMTPWRSEYAQQLVPTMAGIYAQTLGYADVTAAPYAAQGPEDGVAYFQNITGDQGYREGEPQPPACTVAEAVTWLYRVLGPVLAVAGAACALAAVLSWIRARRRGEDYLLCGALLLVLAALLLGVFALEAGLTYSRVSSFIPIAYYYYGSAAYPLMLAFNALAVCGVLGTSRSGQNASSRARSHA